MRAPLLFFCALAIGCSRPAPTPTPSITSAMPSATTPDAAAPTTKLLLPDDAVGPLLARLSERAGDFPSENYVTNETSLLHVAPVLHDAKLHGRAYVGVGPEQNYTYLAILEPSVAYIVDIRRGNMLEHMFFRGCFEAGAERSGFLTALLARRPTTPLEGEFSASAFRTPVDRALQAQALERTKALLDRLHVAHTPADDAMLARIQGAFATHGLSIAYTMTGSQREYPSLAETLAARDPDGRPASFLASEETYARVRRLVVENRVLPVVGDFGSTHALRAVATDMRERGETLGVFYTSNVEQYLFDSRRYGTFTESIGAMPHDDASRIVRVWFDQGRRHPEQQAKHRTTQLAMRVDPFLERAEKKPFKTYWDVVTFER